MNNMTKTRNKRKKQRIKLVVNCDDILHNINQINGCSSKSGLNISFCLMQQLRNNRYGGSNFKKGAMCLMYSQTSDKAFIFRQF